MQNGNGRWIEEMDKNPGQYNDLAAFFMDFAENVSQSLAEIKELLQAKPVNGGNNTMNALPAERQRRGGRPEAIIRRVQVVTAGTAVEGPDVEIPEGVVSVIRQRRHAGAPNGYVALNERDVSSTGSRVEMQNNDTVVLEVSNWNKIWFDADSAETNFELIAEQ